jgi:sulfite exporter TauE/SafE
MVTVPTGPTGRIVITVTASLIELILFDAIHCISFCGPWFSQKSLDLVSSVQCKRITDRVCGVLNRDGGE